MNKSINISASIFIVLGIYIISTSLKFPSINSSVPGPGFFPNILGGTLIALSILLIKNNMKNESEYKKTDNKKYVKTCTSMILTLIYISLLEVLGFIACSIPFLAIMIYLFKCKNIKKNLLVSVLTVLAVYYLFNILLNVPLPEAGILM